MKNIRIYTGILLTAVMIMTLSVSVFAQSNREQNYGVSQVSSSSVHASDKKNNIIFEKKIKVRKLIVLLKQVISLLQNWQNIFLFLLRHCCASSG
mgnify:CR=1 FL=1